MDEQALRLIIDRALETPIASGKIHQTSTHLQDDLYAKRFNTERAVEVFVATMADIVWTSIKERPDGRAIYRDYKASGLGNTYALKLTAAFKQQTGAQDQRPARKFFRKLFGA